MVVTYSHPGRAVSFVNPKENWYIFNDRRVLKRAILLDFSFRPDILVMFIKRDNSLPVIIRFRRI